MDYFSCLDKELSQAGIQEGELAVYTGTVNPQQARSLGYNANSRNAYTYLWQDGCALELNERFHPDRNDLEVLSVQAGEGEYTFLWDSPSGYIRQTAGPAAPIVVANIGAGPLRVDTRLGKFTVHAGTMLRLDENAPRREKKKVLLTVSPQYERPLKSAELWDGGAWRRLNIREEPAAAGGIRSLAVLDGSAIVQYMEVNRKREILMMDAPEPDPDYEIYVTKQTGGLVTLCFNRTDYREGRVVQRARTVSFTGWGRQVVYDLQRLRESQTEAEVNQCAAELPNLPDGEEPYPAPRKRTRPLISDKLREFLEGEDKPSEPLLEPSEGGELDEPAEPKSWNFHSLPAGPSRDCQELRAAPVPEPPEDFPE